MEDRAPGLVLVLWIVLAFGTVPAVVRTGLWGLWFVIAGWGTLWVNGPRALRWGTGHLIVDSVTWNDSDAFNGQLVSHFTIWPLSSGWGPRVVLPVVILWVMLRHQPMGQPITQAFIALAVLFAWQAWL